MPSKAIATGKLNIDEVLFLLREVGFPEEVMPQMLAIALAENEPLNANTITDVPRTGDLSYGIFQINMKGDLGPARRKMIGIKSNEELLDPLTNAKAAYAVWDEARKFKNNKGDGLNAWSSYKPNEDGIRRYEEFLPEATQIVTRTKPTMIPNRSNLREEMKNNMSPIRGRTRPVSQRIPTDLNDIAKIPVGGKEYTLGAAQDLFVKGNEATKNEILTILKAYNPNTTYKQPDSINTAWNKLVANYSVSNSVAKKPFINWLAAESAYNQEILGMSDGTSVFLQPSITSKQDAYEDFNTFIRESVGVNANPKDAEQYYKELTKLEKSKVAKQVTTRSGSTTTQTSTGGITKEDRELLAARFIDRYIDTTGVQNVGGAVGANLGTIRKLASDYNIALSDAEIRRYAVSALTDKNVLETAKVKIKNTAKVRYQNLAPYIDQDLTVKDIASQYINRMANVLEINPDTVKLDNRYIDTALSTLPNFTDFNKILRGGPEWPFTLNAREEAASIINKVKSDFQVA